MKKIQPLVFKLHRTLKNFLQRDGHYLLAVSGGADSMALAAACAALRSEGWGRYSVCHVEHGLRGQEALRDMELVRSFCLAQGLECYVRHVQARQWARQKRLSVEAAARQLRYEALREALAQTGAQAIVTAHNSDDQAETVLLRFLRGAGLTGLGGIRPESDRALRPLLSFSHRQLEEYCRLQQISYCHDSTNDDTAYTRNRVRHELLPFLEQQFNGNIKSALTRLAEQLQAEDALLDALSQIVLEHAIVENNSADKSQAEERTARLALSAGRLRQEDTALRRRALRKAYYSLSGQELDYERTLALERLVLNHTGGKTVQLPGGVAAVYRQRQLVLEKIKESFEHA